MPDLEKGLGYFREPNRVIVTPECFDTCKPDELCEQQTIEYIESYDVNRVDEPDLRLPAEVNVSSLFLCMGGTTRRFLGFKCGGVLNCTITAAPREQDAPLDPDNPYL